MKEPDAPDARNLTAVWHGLYSYPRLYGSVSFVATLIETKTLVTGSTHEPCTLGDGPHDTLYATLLGSRQDSLVSFVKTYDAQDRGYGTVEYEGTLSADGSEIEGRWTVPRVWSGKFLMIRSASAAKARTRKLFEHA
jgi:hypothetical protein